MENVANRESQWTKSPFSAPLRPPSHLPGGRSPPPLPLVAALWAQYLFCSDGHRGCWKAGGRFWTFFVLLFRSFFVLTTLQKKSEGAGKAYFASAENSGCKGKERRVCRGGFTTIHSYSSFPPHPSTRAQWSLPPQPGFCLGVSHYLCSSCSQHLERRISTEGPESVHA